MGADVMSHVGTVVSKDSRSLPRVTLRQILALVKARRYLASRGVATDSASLTWGQWSSALRATGQSDDQLDLWRQRFERANPVTPRAVVSDGDGRMVDLSDALLHARTTCTGAGFNQSLRALMVTAQRTQGQIERYDKVRGRQLSRSTISRMVGGEKLCSRPEQVEAFVRACGHGHEAALWVGAWKAVREGRSAEPDSTDKTAPLRMALMAPRGDAFAILPIPFVLLTSWAITRGWFKLLGLALALGRDDDEDLGDDVDHDFLVNVLGWTLGIGTQAASVLISLKLTKRLIGTRR